MVKKKLLITLIGLVLALFLTYSGFGSQPASIHSGQIQKEASVAALLFPGLEQGQVVRVVDGDTIEVNLNGSGQNEKVRLTGINTPETVDPRRGVECFGHEASNQTKQLLEGKVVILEKDVEDRDKYNRLLRYVYLPAIDNQLLFVNDYLVREGFAQIDTFPPNVKYVDKFTEAQKIAREQNKGLWAKCPSGGI